MSFISSSSSYAKPPQPNTVWVYMLGLFIIFSGTSIYYLSAFAYYGNDSELLPFLISGYVFVIIYTLFMATHVRSYLLDPLVILGGTVLIGVILKVPYLAFHQESLEELLYGKDISVFTNGTYIILFAIVLFMFGYGISTLSTRKSSIPYRAHWYARRFLIINLLLTIITLTCAILALNSIGFANIANNFSSKRFLDLGGGSDRLGSTLYTYYKIALLAKVTAYLTVAYLIWGGAKAKHKKTTILMLLIAIGISALIPTVFNSRAQAILVGLDIFAITYFAGLKLRAKYFAPILVCMYAILEFTSYARAGAERHSGVWDAILSRRYLLDVTKTSQIFDHFKNTGDWFYGETLIGWLFLPIPSSIYPDKPTFIEMGKWIGSNIFDFKLSGVPPGYVGELYLNFGFPGLLVGMFLMGLAIGIFWRWYIVRTLHPAIGVFGAMVIIRFGIFLFNNDFGTFMLKSLTEALPTALLIGLVVSVRVAPQKIRRTT